LCAPHFYAWKKRLREADGGQGVVRAPLAKFVEVKLVPAGRDAGASSVPRVAGDARVEVLLKNGRSLRVGPGFDAELVLALVAVVESAA
jgi:hypothetical protein